MLNEYLCKETQAEPKKVPEMVFQLKICIEISVIDP